MFRSIAEQVTGIIGASSGTGRTTAGVGGAAFGFLAGQELAPRLTDELSVPTAVTAARPAVKPVVGVGVGVGAVQP